MDFMRNSGATKMVAFKKKNQSRQTGLRHPLREKSNLHVCVCSAHEGVNMRATSMSCRRKEIIGRSPTYARTHPCYAGERKSWGGSQL